MTSLLSIIGQIVLTGMQLWKEDQRTRFKDKYHDILKKIEIARTKQFPNYYDVDVDISLKDLTIFLKAYHDEVSIANKPTDK